jgi:hypothetical protein
MGAMSFQQSRECQQSYFNPEPCVNIADHRWQSRSGDSNKNADQEIGEKAERQQEGLLKPNEKSSAPSP